MWRIRDIHIRVEKPTSRVNSFFIRLQGTIWASERTHRPARLWALPCFSPCQAQCGPSLSSGERRGRACCCDITSWFWSAGKRWKTRHHAATVSSHMSSRCPEAPSFLIFLLWKWDKDLCCEPEYMNPGMCHFMNTPLSQCRPLSN